MWCFLGVQSAIATFARFFITKDTNFISNLNDDFSGDSFYVYYVSVRRKLEILGFLPMDFFILTFELRSCKCGKWK